MNSCKFCCKLSRRLVIMLLYLIRYIKIKSDYIKAVTVQLKTGRLSCKKEETIESGTPKSIKVIYTSRDRMGETQYMKIKSNLFRSTVKVISP